MKKIFVFLMAFVSILWSHNFSVFIGTYTEKNLNIQAYLFPKNSKNSRWALSSYTEKLLADKYKDKIKKINLILKKDFNKNTKLYVENSDIRDRNISFIHVDSFQNFTVSANVAAYGIVTFNLTYVQIGEESNRNTSQDSFETRYTKSITFVANTALNENHTLDNFYKKSYTEALGYLLDSVINDTQSKQVSSLMSDDVYFIIDAFKINPELNKLASSIFKNEINAKQQLLIMFQESLIRKIRKNKKLDDVVLLYPNLLNEHIFKNWEEYLVRIKEVSENSLKDNNSEIILRNIKNVCEDKLFDGRNQYLDGYKIQAFLSDLKDQEVYRDSTEINKVTYSSIVARVIISLKDKNVINSISLPNKIIVKPKMLASESLKPYEISKRSNTRRDYEIIQVIKKGIDKISEDVVKEIIETVKKRKGKIVNYQEFCKGIK